MGSAEPSTGFNFNIAMYGEHSEEMEGTEIAHEWAFSSLQKFGQEFLKKLKGKKMPNKLLEKATFAEIPGVLETGTIRKMVDCYLTTFLNNKGMFGDKKKVAADIINNPSKY